ncbi:MAG TPA: response regulator, partial [Polyangiaceae bacterium]|nr:response regulator [Polyangiaceae bacterium]
MPKTLLAVDDSATMRKVLEITFSGEDFKVVLADGAASASRLAESPAAIVVDTVLGADDGYALARELRQAHPNAAIVLLASRYHPYDQGRGRDAGADDFADKPFDTQQLIDKVKKAMAAREAAPVEAPPAPAIARPAAAGLGKSTQPSLGGEVRKNATLIFGDQVPLSPGAHTLAFTVVSRSDLDLFV